MTDAETQRRLELPKIRALLAERTSFAPSRELADALAPTTDLAEAQRLQDETEAARRALRDKPSVGIGGARDIRDAVRRAALGGMLEPRQLLEVADTVRAADRLFRAIDDPRYATLHARARFARPPLEVADAVEHAIAPTAEVLDRASVTLATLRAELRAAQQRLEQRIEAIVRSPEMLRVLQEPIVTQRNGRYVIPVKADFRGQVKGVVHDQSASGQTLFIEPLEILDLGNRVREIGLAEQREVERILTELSGRVARAADDLTAVLNALAAIDLILAKALLAEALEAARPQLVADGVVDLVDARHPLLPAETVVPISIRIGGDYRALVITGPNTGGKTVSLKTTGLLALMAACGLQLPASERSRVPVFRRVFADIGDEQSIAQSLSTFSSHMRNVVAALREARAGDLVLLDEIGAGTDPDEGAALAMAILSALLRRDALVAATTHYPELKAFALGTAGVRNANVEFDAETLQPTYRLRIGLPGASQAFAIAARLGLDAAVRGEAEQHLSELHRSLETTLREAERQRLVLAEAQERLAAELERAQEERRAAEVERRRTLAEARAELERAGQQAEELVLQARRALRAAESAFAQASRKSLVEEARDALAAAEATAESAAPPPLAAGEIAPGEEVLVGAATEPGRLVRIDERGMAEVEAGSARLRVPVSDLRPAPKRERAPLAPRATLPASRDVPLQLDLRGARAEEALEVLDRYLNDAALAGYGRVRIVHGKGTGALRSAVRRHLAGHPLARAVRSAPASEGGEGATVVEL